MLKKYIKATEVFRILFWNKAFLNLLGLWIGGMGGGGKNEAYPEKNTHLQKIFAVAW